MHLQAMQMLDRSVHQLMALPVTHTNSSCRNLLQYLPCAAQQRIKHT
jgi:hypothetical protein